MAAQHDSRPSFLDLPVEIQQKIVGELVDYEWALWILQQFAAASKHCYAISRRAAHRDKYVSDWTITIKRLHADNAFSFVQTLNLYDHNFNRQGVHPSMATTMAALVPVMTSLTGLRVVRLFWSLHIPTDFLDALQRQKAMLHLTNFPAFHEQEGHGESRIESTVMTLLSRQCLEGISLVPGTTYSFVSHDDLLSIDCDLEDGSKFGWPLEHDVDKDFVDEDDANLAKLLLLQYGGPCLKSLAFLAAPWPLDLEDSQRLEGYTHQLVQQGLGPPALENLCVNADDKLEAELIDGLSMDILLGSIQCRALRKLAICHNLFGDAIDWLCERSTLFCSLESLKLRAIVKDENRAAFRTFFLALASLKSLCLWICGISVDQLGVTIGAGSCLRSLHLRWSSKWLAHAQTHCNRRLLEMLVEGCPYISELTILMPFGPDRRHRALLTSYCRHLGQLQRLRTVTMGLDCSQWSEVVHDSYRAARPGVRKAIKASAFNGRLAQQLFRLIFMNRDSQEYFGRRFVLDAGPVFGEEMGLENPYGSHYGSIDEVLGRIGNPVTMWSREGSDTIRSIDKEDMHDEESDLWGTSYGYRYLDDHTTFKDLPERVSSILKQLWPDSEHVEKWWEVCTPTLLEDVESEAV